MKKDKFNFNFEHWVKHLIDPDKLKELNPYLVAILKLRYIEIIDTNAIGIINLDDKSYYAEIKCNGHRVVIEPTCSENALIQAVNRYRDLFNQNY